MKKYLNKSHIIDLVRIAHPRSKKNELINEIVKNGDLSVSDDEQTWEKLRSEKKGWPLAPLILGFLLGDMFEGSLRQSLSMSGGSVFIFFRRPVALLLIIITAISVGLLIKFLRRVPKELLIEGQKL